MKFKIVILIIFVNYYAKAQSYFSEVKYSFVINNENNSVTLDCSLIYDSENNFSSFINYGFNPSTKETRKRVNELDGKTTVKILKYDSSDNQIPEYQKDFTNQTLSSHENIFGEREYFIISEKLPILDWEILKETSSILGQKAQKARLHFRGRDYICWFATDIQISDGPYKFHGLPGLILKIESIDGKYVFEAYSISLNIQNKNLSILPLIKKYPNKKSLNLSEKKKLIDNNIEKERKYRLSQGRNVKDVNIKHSGIEIND